MIATNLSVVSTQLIRWVLFAVLGVGIFGYRALAQSAEFKVPWLSGPVVDELGIVRDSDRAQIEKWTRHALQTGKAQLQVAVLKSLGGLNVESASIQIVEAWKLGSEKGDNGVLLLVAPHERKLRIEVGQGLEGELTDLVSKRVIDLVIVPRLRSGDFSGGIKAGVAAILTVISPESIEPGAAVNLPQGRGVQISSGWEFFFVFMLLVIVMVLDRLSSRRRAWGMGASGWNGGHLGGSSGWSSGGGGWSGSGGGFSGGGASGSW